jgi:dTDP-4-amino-4,6-dideoxygalactose transaminase
VKLRYIETWTEARITHAAHYDQLLEASGVSIPAVMPYSRHVYHVYAVRSPQRDALQQSLQEQEIQTGIHYPIPVHLQIAYSDLGYEHGDFPHSELAATEVLSLPMYAELTSTQVSKVTESLQNILQEVAVS